MKKLRYEKVAWMDFSKALFKEEANLSQNTAKLISNFIKMQLVSEDYALPKCRKNAWSVLCAGLLLDSIGCELAQ